VIAELLIAAIALVHGIKQDVNREGGGLPADVVASFEGGVGGSVVYDEDFDMVGIEKSIRNAMHYLGDGLFGLVSNDEYKNARSICGGHGKPFCPRNQRVRARNRFRLLRIPCYAMRRRFIETKMPSFFILFL
jgi:hypothetical protein